MVDAVPVSTLERKLTDAATADAVDAARAALLDEVDPADVGDHLGHQVDGLRVVTHLFACTRTRLPRLAVGGHARPAPRRRPEDRSPVVRGRARCPARTPSSRRPGCPTATASSRATCRRATCCPVDATTTRGSCRRTPSATTRSTPTRRRRSARSPRTSASAGSACSRPRGCDAAAERWYDGDAGPDAPIAQVCARPVLLLRLPGPPRRPALGDLRRLRQRRRQRRRPRGQPSSTAAVRHSEVRLSKRQQPLPPAPPGPRHGHRRRPRQAF